MKNINLINSERSDIRYALTTFPDGEPHIRFTENIDRKEYYRVICRISNPNDLFVLMQVGDVLNRHEVKFDIVITYLMSMRMDRVVNFEEAFTLKIVAKMINSLHADNVYVYEAHSSRTMEEIENCKPLYFNKLTASVTFSSFNGDISLFIDADHPSVHFNVICFPDNGAFERYHNTQYMSMTDVCILEKHRNLTGDGAVMSMDFKKKVDAMSGDEFLIMDDLCDGGGTFVAAAELLKKEYPTSKFSIFVRHMVNPRGLENLSKNYKNVFITDSYRDWNDVIKEKGYDNVIQIPICDKI